MPARTADLAVIGGGIVGLAHAVHAARRGDRVVLFERDHRAIGASVRNFGMVLVVGQPQERLELARRSRELWLEVARAAGLWHERSGTLLPARSALEAAVLEEFVARERSAPDGRDVSLLTAEQALAAMPRLRADRVRCALLSPAELTVDPREAAVRIPAWLSERHGVRLRYGVPVRHVETGRVVAADGDWRVERIVVCAGEWVDQLLPGTLGAAGAVRCTLQMQRSAPLPDRLGPALLSGLTLGHYPAFAGTPTHAALMAEHAELHPELVAAKVNLMVTQHGTGELTIGDSHRYGPVHEPFADTALDDLILEHLRGLLRIDDARVHRRWVGCYLFSDREPLVACDPMPGVRAVLVAAGIGLSIAFGLAERMLSGSPLSGVAA